MYVQVVLLLTLMMALHAFGEDTNFGASGQTSQSALYSKEGSVTQRGGDTVNSATEQASHAEQGQMQAGQGQEREIQRSVSKQESDVKTTSAAHTAGAANEVGREEEGSDESEEDYEDENGPEAEVEENDMDLTIHNVVFSVSGHLRVTGGDISPTGPCRSLLEKFNCKARKPNEYNLVRCLYRHISTEDDEVEMSEECFKDMQEELEEMTMKLTDQSVVEEACKEDLEQFCTGENLEEAHHFVKDTKRLESLWCLRQNFDYLEGEECQRLITEYLHELASDYELDDVLTNACAKHLHEDHECSEFHGRAGLRGKLLECWMDNLNHLETECQQVVLARMEAAESNYILAGRLLATCKEDKKMFCADVAPGTYPTIDCLLRHADDKHFDEDCRDAVVKLVQQRQKWFRIDPAVMQGCRKHVVKCHLDQKDISHAHDEEATQEHLNDCLLDQYNSGSMTDPACRKAIHHSLKLASGSYSMDNSVAAACQEDRKTYCADIEQGSLEVFDCLEEKRASISDKCRKALFDHHVHMAGQVDLHGPLKDACMDDINKLCEDVPDEHEELMTCLEENEIKGKLQANCTHHVRMYLQNSSMDYRLHQRLADACAAPIKRLCADACAKEVQDKGECGGRMLQCLLQKRDDIRAKPCEHEVDFYLQLEVDNYRLDFTLVEACRDDLKNKCVGKKGSNIEEDEESEPAIRCLINELHKGTLNKKCRGEVAAFWRLEASNMDFRPTFNAACKYDLAVFCSGITAGGSRLFQCTISHVREPGMSEKCREYLVEELKGWQYEWELNGGLAGACEDEVDDLCPEPVKGKGLLGTNRLGCMVEKVWSGDVESETCQWAVGDAAHVAMMMWDADGPVSKVCAKDMKDICEVVVEGDHLPGTAYACLMQAVESSHDLYELYDEVENDDGDAVIDDPVTGTQHAISAFEPEHEFDDECLKLLRVTELNPSVQEQLSMQDTSKSMFSLDALEGAGSSLTGAWALAAVVSVVLVALYGSFVAYRRWRKRHLYTLVAKRRHDGV